MSKQRADNQAVEAFSAPKSLLEEARRIAAEKGMTKSGFFRYCLAKQLGFSEQEAKEMALHNTIQKLRADTLSTPYPRHVTSSYALNEHTVTPPEPSLPPKVKNAADALTRLAIRKSKQEKAPK